MKLNSVQALGLMDDIDEAESMSELEALLRDVESEYKDALEDSDIQEALTHSRARLARATVPTVETGQNEMSDRLVQLQQQLIAMQIAATPKVAIVRSTRSYKLLSFDVKWSSKPQVHAIMQILSASFKVDDVVDEAIIVDAMEQNRHILQTRQTGKKIWDYYKGDHAEGLLMHGNVEKQ